MTKLIVLTDLHMVPEGGNIIGIDPYQRLEAGVDHINLHHSDAELVVVMGDLTHFGDIASYRRVKELLDRLAPRTLITIGNHDDRDTYLEAFADADTDANGFVQQMIDLDDCRVIVLDTKHETEAAHPLRSAGTLCEKRLGWLEAGLGSAGQRPVLVFMHHPPHPTGFVGMDAIRLTNGEDFHDVIARHGNVRHIFAGHVHRTIGGSYRGTPYSIFKSPVHQQPMPFDTPDTSASVDEPGAYGIIVVMPQGVQVHTEDYEIAHTEGRHD